MPYVGDVTHKVDIIAIILEHTTQPIGCHKSAEVADMDISVDGGTAVIYAHSRGIERLKQIFTSCQRVIQVNRFRRNVGHEHISPLKCMVMRWMVFAIK